MNLQKILFINKIKKTVNKEKQLLFEAVLPSKIFILGKERKINVSRYLALCIKTYSIRINNRLCSKKKRSQNAV